MSRSRKKSKAVPVVTVIFILVAALCAACFLFPQYVAKQEESAAADLERRQEEVIARNQEVEATYAARLAEMENQTSATASVSSYGSMGSVRFRFRSWPLAALIVHLIR